jgi:hypothetical protein
MEGKQMKKLSLDSLPYSGTQVPVDRTKGEIQKMLVKGGAEGIQWSDAYKPKRMAQLQFIRKGKLYRLTVPIHTEDLEKQRRYISDYDWEKYMVRREAAMFRAMFYYLEGLIKAEAHGLLSFEEAFVGHSIIHLSSGEETTVADAIISRHLEPGRALPAPSMDDAFAEAKQV